MNEGGTRQPLALLPASGNGIRHCFRKRKGQIFSRYRAVAFIDTICQSAEGLAHGHTRFQRHGLDDANNGAHKSVNAEVDPCRAALAHAAALNKVVEIAK
jgi:hypothetical protein